MRKREADFLAPTGALYTKNALFFQDVSNFFKNGLKWLGYMYIKGFGAELASYRDLKSNRVSGKCEYLCLLENSF